MGNYQQIIEFCENMGSICQENDAQVNNKWLSCDALFHLTGFVNKQNVRYWAAENPRLLCERPLESGEWNHRSSFLRGQNREHG